MKHQLTVTFAACALAAVFMGGCAKHDMVKQDEPLAPANAASQAAAAKLTAGGHNDKSTADGTAVKAAALPAQSQQAAAKPEAVKAALEKVFFDFDSSALSEKARAALAKNAEILKNGGSKVRIEGNCDELGSDDYNLALGERRAKAAQQYLQTMGVAAGRLSTISYGKEKPADPGHSDAARAANRRDEFVLLSK
jgi:peptidoglycan-associated lipoprotein